MQPWKSLGPDETSLPWSTLQMREIQIRQHPQTDGGVSEGGTAHEHHQSPGDIRLRKGLWPWPRLWFPECIPNPMPHALSASRVLCIHQTSIKLLKKTSVLRCAVLCVCVGTQSCLTLCGPRDSRQPGSSVHGIFQARILQWVGISFCRGSSWPRDKTPVSCISCIGRQILYTSVTWEAMWDVDKSWNVRDFDFPSCKLKEIKVPASRGSCEKSQQNT